MQIGCAEAERKVTSARPPGEFMASVRLESGTFQLVLSPFAAVAQPREEEGRVLSFSGRAHALIFT